MKLLVSLVNY